jgi:tRNA threonylcarbamoyladenosine biosynthesis protein TsaE
MTKEFLSHSADETRRFARQFAAGVHEGDIVALCGDLGAGKTEFMRGITEFFVCEEQLSSPTFPLFNIYEGTLRGEPVTLHHFDLYRIESEKELEAIGFDEYLSSAFLSVVEWADRFPSYERFYTATVKLERTGEESRKIIIDMNH